MVLVLFYHSVPTEELEFPLVHLQAMDMIGNPTSRIRARTASTNRRMQGQQEQTLLQLDQLQ